ncbi:MAG: LysM peptidoglycan-binding domain-containing protein [Bdellovibrionaceae bacterium]|nr:LysM peptidoglycan-binding domain-containing protein [Pseudobdellovibrionaceae bacterium]
MHRSMRMISLIAVCTSLTACAQSLRKADSQDSSAAYRVGGVIGGVVGGAVGGELGAQAAPLGVSAEPPLTNEGPVTQVDLADSGEDMKAIPSEVNRLVLQWIDYFQGRGREHMERYLSRSGKYLPMMKEILRKEGLPEDLVYVALIESGFSATAHSSANAVGYWQFIRGTGKRYGLRVDSYVDERRDFVKATTAAADYLKGLYNLFGSWYLAIASYNVGENRIKNLVMRYHTRDFWDLAKSRRLPQETINYVPKFLAARMIAKEPEKYGFAGVNYMQPIQFTEIEVGHSVDLRRMARELNMDYDELSALNPAYKRGIAIESSGKLMLRVPPAQQERSLAAATTALVIPGRALTVAGVPDQDEYSFYRIRRGDTLSTLARRFRTSTRAIRKLNGMSSSARLVAGRRIKVPGESLAGLAKREIKAEVEKPRRELARADRASKAASADRKKVHIVRRGDTLIDIARQYRISLSQLATHNQISRRAKVTIGTRLEIPD